MIVTITMTSHEPHVVPNHRSFNCFFNSLCEPSSKKYQSPYYWPFVRGIHRSWGIHRWPVNSPHKGSVTRKKLPFDDVIMTLAGKVWRGGGACHPPGGIRVASPVSMIALHARLPVLFHKMKSIRLCAYVIYKSGKITPLWGSDSRCDCTYVHVSYK